MARAIYASTIPIVSGIGHEVDFTIADFAADVRAPTPTAAADMVVREKRELVEMLRASEQRLLGAMRKRLEGSKLLLLRSVVELKEKKDFIVRYKMYLDDLSNTLQHNFEMLFREKKTSLQGCIRRLGDLNPESILKRGYSITVRADTRAVVSDAGLVEHGDRLSVKLYRGSLDCTVETTEP